MPNSVVSYLGMEYELDKFLINWQLDTKFSPGD